MLLDDLRQVAADLSKTSLTKEDYNGHGRFCAATMQKRFGSWNKALELSGLSVAKRNSIPRQELLHDLKRVAKALGTETISTESYASLGKFSSATVARTFGSWIKALAAAGLSVSSAWKPKAGEEELFSNMALVWEKVGRQPKQKDFRPPDSRFSADAYVRRYGSWKKALEAFVVVANDVGVENEAAPLAVPLPTESGRVKKRTPRDPGWRLRFLVMRRDNFRCSLCGATQSVFQDIRLDIDHIVPWSAGGETIMENLETLCNRCNIGKSNLAMHEEGG